MPETTTITIRVPMDVKKRLDQLAKATARSRGWLAGQALAEYTENQAWQIAEIKKGLAEADAGDFASDAEVRKVFNKWKKRRR